MASSIQNAVAGSKSIRRGDTLVLAVSGGADSVALLLLLRIASRTLHLRLTVAHLNHGIRGAEADRDAAFVRRLCRRLRVRCITGRADVPRLARDTGISVEMAARDARYRFLSNVARAIHADAIVTAHNADDQAETVLLRLARGTSLHGLAGIPETGEHGGVRVVRPLLGTTRSEIVSFLKRRRQAWREDRSNRDPTYLRNFVRHEILPRMEEHINPRVREAIRRTADIVREEDAWLTSLASAYLKSCAGDDGSLSIPALRCLHVAGVRRVLRLWLGGLGIPAGKIDYAVVDRIASMFMKKHSLAITRSLTVVSDSKRLIALHRNTGDEVTFRAARLPVPGTVVPAGATFSVKTSVKRGIIKDRTAEIGILPARASLNGDAIRRRSLRVRPWQTGDRIRPLGLAGSRKLQDVFVDAKLPADRRRAWPVLVCGSEIVWVPGYRVARGWEVQESTRRTIQVVVEDVRR